MAERQSRIRLACAQMALISLIFVTPMATSSSGLPGKQPDFIRAKTEEGRPFGEVLPLWWTPATEAVIQFRASGARVLFRRSRESGNLGISVTCPPVQA